MDNQSKIIKLKSIEFGEPPFRKFKNIKLEFGDRLTVIAGHNGIGKSTILGLTVNASGITKAAHKSYFDKNYTAPIEEIVILSPEFDYKEDRKNKPNLIIRYEENEKELTKRCNVTKNSEPDSLRLRVHPRTVIYEDGKEKLGSAAKVGIPTIYVGMSRMVPIGENKDEDLHKSTAKVHEEDEAYIKKCFQSILSTSGELKGPLQAYSISSAGKKSRVPDLGIDTFAISLGQDSVSVIVNALASFNKIKRELGENYQGGILAIDEIESGLHPIAQIKLIKLLKKEARKLQIQIIMTTHSLIVIKEIHATQDAKTDAVRYFMNSDTPILLTDNDYLKIESDMLSNPLLGLAAAPTQKIYFEDDEALFFFEEIIKHLKIDFLQKYGTNASLISTRIGCNELLGLANADEDLKSTIIVFDNDTMTSERNREIFNDNRNLISLPSDLDHNENTNGKRRTPEGIIFNFLEKLCSSEEIPEKEDFWYNAAQAYGYSTDSVREILNEYKESNGDRSKNKNLFSKHINFFRNVNLIGFWCENNKKTVQEFTASLNQAITYCQRLQRRR